jgi:hypothetical protein
VKEKMEKGTLQIFSKAFKNMGITIVVLIFEEKVWSVSEEVIPGASWHGAFSFSNDELAKFGEEVLADADSWTQGMTQESQVLRTEDGRKYLGPI